MSVIKMGPVITQIKSVVEKASLPRRVFNFLAFQVHKVTWLLWGRRHAFEGMQRLALGEPKLYSGVSHGPSAVGMLELEQERIAVYRIRGSLTVKEKLPAPDVDDSGLN